MKIEANRFGARSAALLAILATVSCQSSTQRLAHKFDGRWEVDVESELGPIEQVWHVNEDLSGTIVHPRDGSELDIFHVIIKRGHLTFDVVYDIDGESVPARFEGTLDDDAVLGKFVTDYGDAKVIGVRR